MLFTSLEFLYFFLITAALFYIAPHRFRWAVLLIASAYFYSTLKLEYLLYLYIPIVLVYFIANNLNRIERGGKRTALFYLGVLSSILLLFIFKYLDLVTGTIHSAFNIPGYVPLNLILPKGISFYTNKLLSYLIDVYLERLEPEKHLGIFSLYVSFFPQLLAGPIDRAGRASLSICFEVSSMHTCGRSGS